MSEYADGIINSLLNEIAERVVKKITDSNSNWLNTIQYKVRAENIEGQIKASQIDGLEEIVDDVVDERVKEIAADAAEKVIQNARFSVDVSF